MGTLLISDSFLVNFVRKKLYRYAQKMFFQLFRLIMVKAVLVRFWTDFYPFEALSGLGNEIGTLIIILGFIFIHFAGKNILIYQYT